MRRLNDMHTTSRAILMAALCYQTYVQADEDGRFYVPQGYTLQSEIRAKSINGRLELFGFILASDRENIVAFRGTQSTSEWISDAMASQRKYTYVRDGGQVHRGILGIYASARDAIVMVLGQLDRTKPLFITGHSLGGGLAVLCAPDLAANCAYHNVQVYTFGAPRVGDPQFVKVYAQLIPISRRYANLYDAVTYLPPNRLKLPKSKQTFSYIHVKKLEQMEFQNGSISANHVISSYYRELAKKNVTFATQLNENNPGLCPK